MTLKLDATGTVLLKDNEPMIKAASGIGQSILQEVVKFSKGKPFVTPHGLRYVKQSKAWVNAKDSLVLFNVAENHLEAVHIIGDFLSEQAMSSKAKVDTKAAPKAGVVTNNKKQAIILDSAVDSEGVPLESKAVIVDN